MKGALGWSESYVLWDHLRLCPECLVLLLSVSNEPIGPRDCLTSAPTEQISEIV